MAEHDESENHPGPTGEAAAASARVFISYASHDAGVAQKVCSALEAAGLPCWMAPRDVKAGAQYADAIVRAINQAKAVVLVLSGSAVVSSHVAREVERAASKRKQIIAFRIDGAPLSPELEYFLSNSQWIEVAKLGMPAALAKLKEDAGQESASSSLSNPVTRRGSRRAKRFVIAAVVLIAVGVAVALGVHFWSGNHSGAQTPAVAAITDKSIAVLPFVDMSEKKDQEYFADGLAEELLDLLAQVPDLKVPARSSSFYFKGSSVRVRNVGQDLGVAYVLEGGVRKAGDTIRVSVQLVRADSGYQVWAQTYERNVRDIFKVQDEISAAVVDAFKLRLSSPGPQIAERRTANPDAYDQYLRGKHLFQLGDYDDLLAARDAYRRAIELDPNFGPAFADLAMVEYLAVKDYSDTDQPDVIRQAMDHADHAVALAPSLAEAYSDRALLRFAQYDWAGARADLQKALALDPNDVKANRRMVLLQLSLGNVVAALSAQQHVVDLDPLDMISLEILGMSYYFAGQGGDARRTFEKVRVFSPTFEGLSGNVGFSYLADGQPAAARHECELYPDDTARACLAAAEHALGHDERSRVILADLIERHPRRACYFIAKAYGFSGNSALAFEWLNRAFSAQTKYLTDLKSEPAFRALHGDPRYLGLLRKMNLPVRDDVAD
jgi:TolB-like protein/Flp pilus assembly protein TadD